jgi:hypothetical protein
MARCCRQLPPINETPGTIFATLNKRIKCIDPKKDPLFIKNYKYCLSTQVAYVKVHN